MIKLKLVTICFGALMYFAGCKGNKNTTAGDTSKMKSFGLNSNASILTAAGNTEVSTPLARSFAVYGKNNRIRVNFQLIGSTNAITALANRTIDFAITDTPLTTTQEKQLGKGVLQIHCLSSAGKGDSNKGGWIVLYKEQNYNGRSRQRAENLVKMLWWDIHEGQQHIEGVNYKSLSPGDILDMEKTLKSATFNGKPVLP